MLHNDRSSPVHQGMEAAYQAAKKLQAGLKKPEIHKKTIADSLWAHRGDGLMKAVASHEGQNAAYQSECTINAGFYHLVHA